jgi:GMP synthase (glutamine-hydrolysing)
VKPLICVRHAPNIPLGIISDVLSVERVTWRHHDCWTDETLPDVEDIAGMIVLGGKMKVDELDEYPYLGTLRDFTREAIEAELPVLGVCLGAQIMTRALGAKVIQLPVKEIGFLEVRATARDDVMEPFAPSMPVLQFHEDACELPDGAELLYESDLSGVQAFKVGDRAYATQFHFEVTEREIESWCDETPDLESVWGVTKDDLLLEAKHHLDRQQSAGREATRRFLSLL